MVLGMTVYTKHTFGWSFFLDLKSESCESFNSMELAVSILIRLIFSNAERSLEDDGVSKTGHPTIIPELFYIPLANYMILLCLKIKPKYVGFISCLMCCCFEDMDTSYHR